MNPFRILGLGRLPREAFLLVKPAEPRIAAEHVLASVTLIDFRGPGKRCAWNRKWFIGSIALTDERLVAFWWRRRLINLLFSDVRAQQVEISAPQPRRLFIAHDAGLFRSNWSGRIEYRFRTAAAERIAAAAHASISKARCAPDDR